MDSPPYGMPVTSFHLAKNVRMRSSLHRDSKPYCQNNSHSPAVISAPNSILLLNDVQLPFEDRHAIKNAIEVGKENKAKTIVLRGDLIDFFAIKKFISNPKERKLKHELAHAKTFLATLRKSFPLARILYKQGNHDFRWNKYLWIHAEQLSDVDDFQLENILGLKPLKIEMVGEGNAIYLGSKLTYVHGHESPLLSLTPASNHNTVFLWFRCFLLITVHLQPPRPFGSDVSEGAFF